MCLRRDVTTRPASHCHAPRTSSRSTRRVVTRGRVSRLDKKNARARPPPPPSSGRLSRLRRPAALRVYARHRRAVQRVSRAVRGRAARDARRLAPLGERGQGRGAAREPPRRARRDEASGRSRGCVCGTGRDTASPLRTTQLHLGNSHRESVTHGRTLRRARRACSGSTAPTRSRPPRPAPATTCPRGVGPRYTRARAGEANGAETTAHARRRASGSSGGRSERGAVASTHAAAARRSHQQCTPRQPVAACADATASFIGVAAASRSGGGASRPLRDASHHRCAAARRCDAAVTTRRRDGTTPW